MTKRSGDILLLFKGCSGSGKTETMKYAMHFLLWSEVFRGHIEQINLAQSVVELLSVTPLLTQSGLSAQRIGSYSSHFLFPHDNQDGRFTSRKIGVEIGNG